MAGELNYIVPFMCAVLTAKLVGDLMTPSIYDAHAKLNGALEAPKSLPVAILGATATYIL